MDHMVSLINLLKRLNNTVSASIERIVHSAIVFTNCQRLRCQYTNIGAYRLEEISGLIYEIQKMDNVLNADEIDKIVELLKSTNEPSIRFTYTKSFSNYYAYFMEISKLEKEWIREYPIACK